MFLDVALERNPQLCELAIELHQTGLIPPDTYLLDIDAISANAEAIASTSAEHGITPWFITKQFGRNPLIAQAIAKHIPSCTVVDFHEYRRMRSAGIKVANIGHLVQMPPRLLANALQGQPETVTVSSLEMLHEVGRVCEENGTKQGVLLKIRSDDSEVYPGQEGGFRTVAEACSFIDQSSYLSCAGVTGFPSVLFKQEQGNPVLTKTAHLVKEAHTDLCERYGKKLILNLPSHSSVATTPMLAEFGATHSEPGHALTGTTPQHAVDYSLPEIPAYVYVSEIAQTGVYTSVYGGGFYPRGQIDKALFVSSDGTRTKRALVEPTIGNIDYYRIVRDGSGLHIGDTALMAFRSQIFVTRSLVAVVSPSQRKILGFYDSQGLLETEVNYG
ncbi:alanine racemase [Boudabousia marimammalium]|uniref:Uncharacterized protein n=1 Tax=Boudabousia marimammalium TaxID=156892 RepID=A0A1Q5PSB7_9ACTO|nr:alanine racemase [Boudabousia marimammalium]OKL50478.1 hypothetical protein BM477_00440 [Boudabousia marimammalium]